MAEDLTRLTHALADRYRIERLLGSGGMAAVYLAEDLKHKRLVAIKVLDPELAAAIGSERFLREIRLTARLNHPHILALHDSGDAAGQLYYVMPYVEGESLRQRLAREKQLPVEEAVRLTREIVAALEFAHGQGIVHRDIKPENILLSNGWAMVADFGIARVMAAGGNTLTTRGAVLGTPAYMSPEQAAGAELIDGRSDIYSTACVLYEMLGGQPPFTGATAESVLYQHLAVEPPPVSNLRPGVPPAMTGALRKALSKAAADRYPTAAVFSHSLGEALTAPAETRPRPALLRSAWVGVIAIAVLAVVVGGAFLRWRRFRAPARLDSIAVLPLANMSGDPTQLYFADGMTEELISELARISGIKVISRTSIMGYRERPKPVRQIARELDVEALVEGSVRQEGSRVRITIHLIDAKRDHPLWSESFDREVRDVLTLQGEIARAIAEKIRIQLTPQEKETLTRIRPVDPRAHEAYLRGRSLIDRMDGQRYRRALEAFQEATRLDPGYAEAWMGLAETYYLLSSVYMPADQAMPRVREASQRALALDPSFGAAHGLLGMVLGMYEWRRDEAERHFQRALDLSPNNATVHWQYSTVLSCLGRHDEAIAHWIKAEELDPLSPYLFSGRAYWLYVAGRYDEAEASIVTSIRRDSTYAPNWYNLAQVAIERGRSAEAIRAAVRATQLEDTGWGRMILACVYVRAGREREARAELQRMGSEDLWTQPSYFAKVYAQLGDKERAFAALDRAYVERDEGLNLLRVDPLLRSLADDPRFEALAQKINL